MADGDEGITAPPSLPSTLADVGRRLRGNLYGEMRTLRQDNSVNGEPLVRWRLSEIVYEHQFFLGIRLWRKEFERPLVEAVFDQKARTLDVTIRSQLYFDIVHDEFVKCAHFYGAKLHVEPMRLPTIYEPDFGRS